MKYISAFPSLKSYLQFFDLKRFLCFVLSIWGPSGGGRGVCVPMKAPLRKMEYLSGVISEDLYC